MKRNWKAAVATARIFATQITRRSMPLAAFAGVIALAPAAMAQGEHIVSSQVVSDTVVSTSDSGSVSGGCASGDCGGTGEVQGREYGQPDLFFNYYTQGAANSANAQMYVAPVPVPPNVGHTYYTYQPFYPHEMLYWHKDRYHNYYDNGRGMNRTRAIYYSPPVRQAASNFYWNTLRLPR